MKPLTKKILESGIIERHTAQMFEQWAMLEPGDSKLVGKNKLTKETLDAFIEDLDALIDEDVEMKETRFELNVRAPILLFCPQIKNPKQATFAAYEDELGRFIVAPNIKLFRGAMVTPDELGKIVPRPRWWTVLEVEPLFQGEKQVANQVTIEKD